MPAIFHLSRAPIVEALVNFQANASRLWNPERIRPAFATLWPEHAEFRELRSMKIEVAETPAGQLPPKVTFPPVEGFFFRSKTQPTVHQARRDGYTFSWLEPYKNWETLETEALAGWEDYKKVLEPEELHAVAVRFTNKVKFSAEGFTFVRYFTTPPVPPPGLPWGLHGFMHQSLYAVPDSSCVVKATIAPAFDGALPETFAFIVDIDITLKQSLPALERSVEVVLAEMHDLKNKAFFHLLTEEALQAYK